MAECGMLLPVNLHSMISHLFRPEQDSVIPLAAAVLCAARLMKSGQGTTAR
jgi:hypothetical protein